MARVYIRGELSTYTAVRERGLHFACDLLCEDWDYAIIADNGEFFTPAMQIGSVGGKHSIIACRKVTNVPNYIKLAELINQAE